MEDCVYITISYNDNKYIKLYYKLSYRQTDSQCLLSHWPGLLKELLEGRSVTSLSLSLSLPSQDVGSVSPECKKAAGHHSTTQAAVAAVRSDGV